ISALVGGNTAFVGFTGGTGGLNAQQDIQTWTYTPQTGTGIDHANGFAQHADLQANRNLNSNPDSAVFPPGSAVARLTPAQNGQAGSFFSKNPVNVQNFTTTFTFQLSAGTNPIADGFTFTLQNHVPANFSEAVVKLSPTGPGQQMTVPDYF